MGKIDYEKTSKTTFNNNNALEREIQERTDNYSLNKDEKAEVRELFEGRQKALQDHKKDFTENKKRYVKAEYDRLRAERKNTPQLNLGPAQSSDARLYDVARGNVRANYQKAHRDIHKNTDRQLNKKLETAREQGRGPVQQNAPARTQQLNQDFQRANTRNIGR